MDLQIKPPKQHGYRLIAVPWERLNDKPPMDYSHLVSGDDKFKIIEHFMVEKSDKIFPYSLFLLAVGGYVKKDDIWKVYNKSDKIIIYIVEK